MRELPKRFGPYTVLKYLKSGGEADVYCGKKSRKKDLVAIKVMHIHGDNAAVRRNFRAEVRKLQQLDNHPHIISLEAFGTRPGFAYIVMPYIEGGSLADRANRGEWPTFDDGIKYIEQAAEALDYIHQQGVIHWDIKPHNLLLGDHGILISDFGIAIGDTTVLPERLNMITPEYCAPERLLPNPHPAPASDQYSLAATACWLLTKGQRYQNGGLDLLRRDHPKIAPVLERALQNNPDQRYPSMKHFLNDLAATTPAALKPGPVPPQELPPNRPFQPRPRPGNFVLNRLLLGILVGVLLIGLTFGGIRWFQPQPTTMLCVATDLPNQGTEGPTGQQILNGIQLAFKQDGPLLTTPYHGYQLVESDWYDTPTEGPPDPQTGVDNLKQIIHGTRRSCPNPIAVIGPYDSYVAASEIPIAVKNQILLLSPSNTAPCLTQSAYIDPSWGCVYTTMYPSGINNGYARLVDTDIAQGSVDADFLHNPPNPTPGQGGLGANRIEIVEDEEPYGVGLATTVIQKLENSYGFTSQQTSQQIEVDCITSASACSQLSSSTKGLSIGNIQAFSTSTIPDLVNKIKKYSPDAIFYGGLYDMGGALLRHDLGGSVPFVGASALLAAGNSFFNIVGSDTSKIYATFPAADISNSAPNTPAGIFVRKYESQHGPLLGYYSAKGYDAASIVIQAIKKLIDGANIVSQAIKKLTNEETIVTKENVFSAVINGSFKGVAGNTIQFDPNGDVTGPQVYTIYQAQGHSWQDIGVRYTDR